MKTDLNEVTVKQRIPMLLTPPAFPVKGRGCKRIDFGLAEDWMFKLPDSPHIALVSVREAINCFGKLGTPKHFMVSPEFAVLFE